MELTQAVAEYDYDALRITPQMALTTEQVTNLVNELANYHAIYQPHFGNESQGTYINTKPRADEDRNLSIKHVLATTDCWIVLQQACKQANMTLEWTTERELRSVPTDSAAAVNSNGHELKPPIPDALFTILHEQKKAVFHLEVDRSTEDIGLSIFERQSITAKVIEYLTWEGSDHYRREYGTRPLRVCFITVGARRMRNMIQAAEKVLKQRLEVRTDLSEDEKQVEFKRMSARFRFITFDTIHPQTVLTQPVWSIAGGNSRCNLFG